MQLLAEWLPLKSRFMLPGLGEDIADAMRKRIAKEFGEIIGSKLYQPRRCIATEEFIQPYQAWWSGLLSDKALEKEALGSQTC